MENSTVSCIFVSVTELTFSHESGRRFQRLEMEMEKLASMSLWSDSQYISVYFMCGRDCVSVYSILFIFVCAAKNVCTFPCIILNLDFNSGWPFAYKTWDLCGFLTSNDGLDTKPQAAY